ncbi:MAG: hypothetical protein TE42_04400 [Candidatus Synechococcus spongiarum SP3]|uniref:Uncharacterized protein n=1 Tax=Candidatus Synechococcus spongiarum SP3 TaxID=1604020 RepID=A0A0G2IWH0_9SYNE|nr:MAG: hypothetical protein TE42_04400 [Candidatus Synechococcus spongiarum SP3]
MRIVELPVDISTLKGRIILYKIKSCKSKYFAPCVGISASIQQSLHHCWGLALHRSSKVEGCPSIFASCVGINTLR